MVQDPVLVDHPVAPAELATVRCVFEFSPTRQRDHSGDKTESSDECKHLETFTSDAELSSEKIYIKEELKRISIISTD